MVDIDAEGLRAAQAGDIDAWRRLMQTWMPHVAAYLGTRLRRPEIVDDLLPEIIHSAWRHREAIEEVEGFPRWLRKIAARYAMRWRKEHKGESLASEFPAERCRKKPQQLAALQRLDAHIGQLEEQERMAVEQWYRGGVHDLAVIADVLHTDVEEARAALERGIQQLAKAHEGEA